MRCHRYRNLLAMAGSTLSLDSRGGRLLCIFEKPWRVTTRLVHHPPSNQGLYYSLSEELLLCGTGRMWSENASNGIPRRLPHGGHDAAIC